MMIYVVSRLALAAILTTALIYSIALTFGVTIIIYIIHKFV